MDVETRSFELVPVPGRVIRGKVDAPAGAEPGVHGAVLVLHGFKGFMDWGFFPELGRRLAAAGLVAVRFNASGSGVGPDLQSFSDDYGFASNTYSQELDDLDQVRAFVRAGGVDPVDPSRLGVFGHSRGGGMVLIHAAERGDYRAVVTWSAISRVERFDEATLATWRADGELRIPNARTGQVHRIGLAILHDVEQNRARLDVRAACGRLATPTLVVHGSGDEAVGFDEGQAIAAAVPEPARTFLAIEGAGHTFGARHPWAGPTPELERALDATTAHFAGHLAPESTVQ